MSASYVFDLPSSWQVEIQQVLIGYTDQDNETGPIYIGQEWVDVAGWYGHVICGRVIVAAKAAVEAALIKEGITWTTA